MWHTAGKNKSTPCRYHRRAERSTCTSRATGLVVHALADSSLCIQEKHKEYIDLAESELLFEVLAAMEQLSQMDAPAPEEMQLAMAVLATQVHGLWPQCAKPGDHIGLRSSQCLGDASARSAPVLGFHPSVLGFHRLSQAILLRLQTPQAKGNDGSHAPGTQPSQQP